MRALGSIGLVAVAVLIGAMAWHFLDIALGGPGAVERGLVPLPAWRSSRAESGPAIPYLTTSIIAMDSKSSPSTTSLTTKIARAIRHALIYAVNGALAMAYFIANNIATVVMLALAGAAAFVERKAPGAHRVFTGVVLLVSVIASLAVPPPIPIILAVMWVFVPVIPLLDPAGGQTLSWRARSGIALYAGACVLYLAYSRLTAGVTPEAWAALAGGVDEARTVMAQSRAYITTMANIALWFVMPVAYVSLIAQAILVHPFPTAPFRSVAERIRLLRTRGVE